MDVSVEMPIQRAPGIARHHQRFGVLCRECTCAGPYWVGEFLLNFVLWVHIRSGLCDSSEKTQIFFSKLATFSGVVCGVRPSCRHTGLRRRTTYRFIESDDDDAGCWMPNTYNYNWWPTRRDGRAIQAARWVVRCGRAIEKLVLSFWVCIVC